MQFDERSFAPPRKNEFYWTETRWWPFQIPDRKMAGMLYALFRPNLGLCTTSVHLWDETSDSPPETPYSRTNFHIPIPAGAGPCDYELLNGLSCKTMSNGNFNLNYHDQERLSVELEVAALQPHHFAGSAMRKSERTASWAGETDAGHFDQPIQVTGEVLLRGEKIPINCFGCRDASWSVRSEQGPDWPPMGYSFATVSPETGFNIMSRVTTDTDAKDYDAQTIVGGYLMLDSQMVEVAGGQRKVTRRVRGRPKSLELSMVDERGRTLEAAGECVNRLAFIGNTTTLIWWSLVKWTLGDGRVVWGQDSDSWWPAASWQVSSFSR